MSGKPFSGWHHKPIEERREFGMPIERENVRDELVRPHDHDAAAFAIDAARSKDVIAALHIRAEDLLVVAKSITPLLRQEE